MDTGERRIRERAERQGLSAVKSRKADLWRFADAHTRAPAVGGQDLSTEQAQAFLDAAEDPVADGR